MRKVFALISIMALVGGTACERPTKDLLNVPVISEIDAVPAILAAQARVRAAGNARLKSVIRFQDDGQPFVIVGTGLVDFAKKRTVITFDLGGPMSEGEKGPAAFSLLLTQKTLYIGVVDKITTGTELPTRWGSIDRANGLAILGQLSGGTAAVDPGDAFLPLRGVQPGADFVGSEPIEGVQTSEFYVTIDPNEALRRAVGPEKLTVRQQLFDSGDLLKVAVWLGADGTTYRYRLSVGAGQTLTTITTTMWDQGKADPVTLPRASQVDVITNPMQLQALFAGVGSPAPDTTAEPSPSGSPSGSPSPSGSASASPAPSPSA